MQGNLKKCCRTLGIEKTELLLPVGQREETKEELREPRRSKSCAEQAKLEAQ